MLVPTLSSRGWFWPPWTTAGNGMPTGSCNAPHDRLPPIHIASVHMGHLVGSNLLLQYFSVEYLCIRGYVAALQGRYAAASDVSPSDAEMRARAASLIRSCLGNQRGWLSVRSNSLLRRSCIRALQSRRVDAERAVVSDELPPSRVDDLIEQRALRLARGGSDR